MKKQYLTKDIISDFEEHLKFEERSRATVEKYIRDIKTFAVYLNGEEVKKETVIAYKKHLQDK